MLIEIYDTGEMGEITNHETTLKEDSVYLLLSYRNKRTYIWNGKDANVRKRFIAAKEARRIKMETGFQTFNVQHDDMYDDFEQDFRNYMNDLKTHQGLPQVLAEQRERLREVFVNPETSPRPTEAKTSKTKETKNLERVEKPLPVQIDPRDIASEFSKLERPKGMVRDYLIVNGQVFTIVESEEGLDLTALEELPDGFFDVKPYEPRVLIKDSKVIGIEFWRKR